MAQESGGGGRGAGSQRWATFVRNHAQAVVACDFCVAVTATFRVLYVFVAMEIGSRRLLHVNVTSHPTAVWTVQQFRETLAAPHAYRFVLHDRGSIYSPWLDAAITAMGVRVLRTPVRAPTAKDYASHCTSLACSGVNSGRRLWESLTPWALRGGWSPGCSYSQSGFAVYA